MAIALVKPYVIGVSSQKGGVGKTTISVNLAVAIKQMGYKALLVDSDTTNPSIGFHFGLEQVNIGYRDVLYGKVDLNDATITHVPTGIRILPGTINIKQFNPSLANIQQFGSAIGKANYDYIIFDTAPGFVEEDLSAYYDEALIVAVPEMSACASSIRLAHQYDKSNVRHNIVVNRIQNKKYEISLKEIEDIYEKKAIGTIPEDEIVPISISDHIPAYMLRPNSKFSERIAMLAEKYVYGESVAKRAGKTARKHRSFFAFLRWLFRQYIP